MGVTIVTVPYRQAQGNYAEAIQSYDRALAIDPNYKDALVNKGLALYGKEYYSQAITYFDKALAIDPNDQNTLILKGVTLESQGNYAQAIQYFNQVLHIDPNNQFAKDLISAAQSASCHTEVCTLINKAEDFIGDDDQKAIQYFDQALAIDPNNLEALMNKGTTLINLGDYTQAIQCFDKILAILPNNKDASDFKQIALSRMGQ